MNSDSERATIHLVGYPDLQIPCLIKVDKENLVIVETHKVPLKLEFEDRFELIGKMESGDHFLIREAWINSQQGDLAGEEYDYIFQAFEIIIGASLFNHQTQCQGYQFDCDFFSEWKNSRLLSLDPSGEIQMTLTIPKASEERLFYSQEFSAWLKYKSKIQRKFRPEHGFDITESWSFEIRSDTLKYEEFKEIGRKLGRFFAFAIQRPIEAKPRYFKQGDEWYKILQYFLEKPTEDQPPLHLDKILAYHEIKNKFQHILGKWFQLYEICGPSIDTYLGIQTNEHLYWENRYLMQLQAFEGLHKGILGSKKFSEQVYTETRKLILESIPEEHRGWISSMINNEPSLSQRIREVFKNLRITLKPWYYKHMKHLKESEIAQYRHKLTHPGPEKVSLSEVAQYTDLVNKINQELILSFLGIARHSI